MPRTADKTDIPNRLLRAGRELFSRQGFNATGIQQITDHAGVPKGSFYNHFESKEAFAVEIIAQYAAYLQRSWEAMIEAAPQQPMAAIRYVFAQMIAYHERKAMQSGCLVGNFAAEIGLASEPCRIALLDAQLAWRERLTGMISRAQAQGDIRDDIAPDALSGLAWDAWEGALLRMKLEQSVEPLRLSVDLILDRLFPAVVQPTVPR
jgi:TetR/AcrR family transcriptional regulator, transcriptional repressor for nem operon